MKRELGLRNNTSATVNWARHDDPAQAQFGTSRGLETPSERRRLLQALDLHVHDLVRVRPIELVMGVLLEPIEAGSQHVAATPAATRRGKPKPTEGPVELGRSRQLRTRGVL